MKYILSVVLSLMLLFSILGCSATNETIRVVSTQASGESGAASPEATAPSKTGGDTGEPSPEATHTGTPTETTGLISEEAAWQIALEHAGLTKDQVTRSRVELDRDDGRMEYEVEFHHGTVEYDYEIDAASGSILSFDRDND